MRIGILIFFLAFGQLASKAQGYNNLWLMGYENYSPLPWGATNIDYFTGVPNAYFEPNRTMQLKITEAVVTDSSGSLLFYTNGAWIANRNNVLMQHGDSLNPSYYTSSNYQRGLSCTDCDILLKHHKMTRFIT